MLALFGMHQYVSIFTPHTTRSDSSKFITNNFRLLPKHIQIAKMVSFLNVYSSSTAFCFTKDYTVKCN